MPIFAGFWLPGSLKTRDWSGFGAFALGKQAWLERYRSPKSTVRLGARAAAMGLLSASTMGAATLK
jgi:hypothetical protein